MGFSERFPRWTSAVVGIAQLVLTAAIVGLEVGSVYIDLAHGTIWVGFWASLVFIKTFLMMLFISKIFFSVLIFMGLFVFYQPAVAAVVVVPPMYSYGQVSSDFNSDGKLLVYSF